MNKKKIGVVSLGCDKNRVDTEKMLAIVSERYALTPNAEEADIIIINTCAFLESARVEAIDEILLAIEQKKSGSIEKIIVSGCLPQKFINEIFDELIEVDAFLGVSDYSEILSVIDRIYKGERVNAVKEPKNEIQTKRVLTTSDYAYLKIADGCDNHCTYCLIPKIRGKYRSIDSELLIKEVKELGKVKELILVAQDTTAYGKDLCGKENLVSLIKKLSALDNVKSIRLLYCYPENITDELIFEIATNDKVIKYLDIPLQHADDKILKLMNRKGSGESYLALIEKLRSKIKGVAIRSTFITGFPREDEISFNNLVEFLRKAKLTSAGFFAYSREEGTASYNLTGHIDEKEKQKRLKKLYSVQKQIVSREYKKFVGKTIKVICEGFDENQFVYYGRAYYSAPDIDGKVYFFSADETVCGEEYEVQIIKNTGYDLYGERL